MFREHLSFRRTPPRIVLPGAFCVFLRSPPYVFVFPGDNVILKSKRSHQGALTEDIAVVAGVRLDPNRAVRSTFIHRLSLTKLFHIIGLAVDLDKSKTTRMVTSTRLEATRVERSRGEEAQQ